MCRTPSPSVGSRSSARVPPLRASVHRHPRSAQPSIEEESLVIRPVDLAGPVDGPDELRVDVTREVPQGIGARLRQVQLRGSRDRADPLAQLHRDRRRRDHVGIPADPAIHRPVGCLRLIEQRGPDHRRLRIPVRPDALGEPHGDIHADRPRRVEINHGSLTLEIHHRQQELIARSAVYERRQGMLFVVHAIERRAVGSTHPQERPPLVDDQVLRRLRGVHDRRQRGHRQLIEPHLPGSGLDRRRC